MEVVRAPAHGDKLKALVVNDKLPASDRVRVEEAVKRYNVWVQRLREAKGNAGILLGSLVKALNDYKQYIELDLIFDAKDDFLYRQKGQLKLDNTILEEFLPYLFDVRLVPGLARIKNLNCGSQSSFAGLSLGVTLNLAIEAHGLERLEPRAEFRVLVGRQAGDGFLKVFDAHIANIIWDFSHSNQSTNLNNRCRNCKNPPRPRSNSAVPRSSNPAVTRRGARKCKRSRNWL